VKTRLAGIVVFIVFICLLGWVGRGWAQKASTDRKVWEYKVGTVVLGGTPSVQDRLNELGAEGWELVAVENVTTAYGPSALYYLKRAKGASPDSNR